MEQIETEDLKRLRNELSETFEDLQTRTAYCQGQLFTYLAAQLSEIRQQRGFTQKELEKMARLRKGRITQLESDGNRTIKLPELLRIADCLGVRVRVSFETFGSGVEEHVLLHRIGPHAFFGRPKFGEEGQPNWMHEHGTPGLIKRIVIPWIYDPSGEPDRLLGWCTGGFGETDRDDDRCPHYQQILDALDGQKPWMLKILKRRAESILEGKNLSETAINALNALIAGSA